MSTLINPYQTFAPMMPPVGTMMATAAPYVRSAYSAYKKYGNKRRKTLRIKDRRRPGKHTGTAPRKKTIKHEIRAMKKHMNHDMGTHTYRKRDVGELVSVQAQNAHASVTINNTTNLEVAMAGFRYYNPAVPGTLTTADASTGTYSREIFIKDIRSRILVRNNYLIPVKIRIYCLGPKDDTNIAPLTQYTSGMADQGNPSTLSPLIHLTDSDLFNDTWNILSSKATTLGPGREFSVSHGTGEFYYDPSVADTHTVQYQKKWKAFVWVIRIEGTLQHPNDGTNEYAIGVGGIDFYIDSKFVFNYDAGVNLNDFTILDNSDATFSSGTGVCTNMPISDNQSYGTG